MEWGWAYTELLTNDGAEMETALEVEMVMGRFSSHSQLLFVETSAFKSCDVSSFKSSIFLMCLCSAPLLLTEQILSNVEKKKSRHMKI